MKKLLLLALTLCLLAGCSPSPQLVTVNGKNLDGSEYAFYLNYQLLSVENPDELTDEQVNTYKEQALKQMVLNEIVRQKCKEFDLALSKEQKNTISTYKDDFINQLGGKAEYLNFLNNSAMNDITYIKSQENTYYHDLLFSHLSETGVESDGISFTDEALRKYFSDNYLKIKYIHMSHLNDLGEERVDAERQEFDKYVSIVANGCKEKADVFDSLIEKYNDDDAMTNTPEGFVWSISELSENPIFKEALQIEENKVGGPYNSESGYLIIKRMPIDAGYFDRNNAAIRNEAVDAKFNELLNKWYSEATISTHDIYTKINSKNFMDYLV